jgi:hypothetical protein
MDLMGVTHIHHFYLPRATSEPLGCLWKVQLSPIAHPQYAALLGRASGVGLSNMNRYKPSFNMVG